jgi:1-acyl-sn-glycerol-3-phosphate acyltransferase
MRRILAKLVLKLIGWNIVGSIPPDQKKVIVTMAPHTSNWDFVLGWLGYSSIGLNSKYLIKKEAFFFPLGYLVKWLGGIPVDRGKKNNVVLEVGDLFQHTDQLIITITPEGTRSLNKNWKRGFYYIAQHARVPIMLGFLDYKNKTGGFGPLVHVTGDYEKDMAIIEGFYKQKAARYPAMFNLSPQYQPPAENK